MAFDTSPSQVLLCQGTTQQLYSLVGVNLTVLCCPGESPPQGSHHLNWHPTKGPRQRTLCHPPHSTAQHQVPVTVLHWCWELEVFSFPSHQLYLSENRDSAGLASVCDLAQREMGAKLRKRRDGGELTVSLSSLGAGMGRSCFGPRPSTRAGAAAVRAAACAGLLQLIAALRACLHGKIYQRNYPTVIIPG